jgi:HD-GYP domain-containing protein (c-di-GMP phosphodiesterase class II)
MRRGDEGVSVPKLVLKVSPSVPELPAAVSKEKNLTVKRVKTITTASLRPTSDGDIVAWFLDPEFVAAHGPVLKAASPAPGSLLLWNPRADSLVADSLPADLVFDEVASLKNPAWFLRTVRNLFRRLYLERELAQKEVLLEARESENKELREVGTRLSTEKDNDKLLDYILRQIRHIARADAGTLYLIERDATTGQQKLLFKVAQNDSNPQDYKVFSTPLTKKSVSGYVAITGRVLYLEDAYRIPPGKEYGFNISYDKSTGYRSKSMLTVPMRNHKDEIIGVIQLINCKLDRELLLQTPEDADTCVIPFSKDIEPVVLSLASQAAVSLENNRLYQEIETLFEGFVRASVQAIESRDPTTSGHSNRVATYTVGLAKVVDRITDGVLAEPHFNAEQLKEIRYASLLHDFGKVGVREHVLVKAKKLYPQQMDLVGLRFRYIKKAMLYALMKERFETLLRSREEFESRKTEFDRRESEYLSEIESFLKRIVAANEPNVLAEEPERILGEIHGKTFEEQGEPAVPFLTDDEYIKLSIPKGSLDESERKEIESHVTHTFRFLSTIPWTKEMRNIPAIAYGHHEKLDGEGYPRGIHSPEIPVQTRMMTVSDIFDALTASDRPYKRAVPPHKALDILTAEVREKKLDAELVKVFIEAKVWEAKA